MLTNPESKTPGRLLVRKIAVGVILCGVIPKDCSVSVGVPEIDDDSVSLSDRSVIWQLSGTESFAPGYWAGWVQSESFKDTALNQEEILSEEALILGM